MGGSLKNSSRSFGEEKLVDSGDVGGGDRLCFMIFSMWEKDNGKR